MDGAVRVQLPAGDAFVPAIVDAAATYASRRDLTPAAERVFVDLVEASARALVAAGATTINFAAVERGGVVEAELRGPGASALTKRVASTIESRAKNGAEVSVRDGVRFSIPTG